jgi:hypothetical protein
MSQETRDEEEFYSQTRKYSNAQDPLIRIEQDYYTVQSHQNDKSEYDFYKNKGNTRQKETMRTDQTTIRALENFINLQHQVFNRQDKIINRQDRFINCFFFVFGLSFVIILFFIVLFVLRCKCNFKN